MSGLSELDFEVAMHREMQEAERREEESLMAFEMERDEAINLASTTSTHVALRMNRHNGGVEKILFVEGVGIVAVMGEVTKKMVKKDARNFAIQLLRQGFEFVG